MSCPVCGAETPQEAPLGGRPSIYCGPEHRAEAEAERARLRTLLTHLGRRRVANIEQHALRPNDARQAVIDALDAEIRTTRSELVRLSAAAGTTPQRRAGADE